MVTAVYLQCMGADCSLCGLATPSPPIRDSAGAAYCCPGCRDVATVVEDLDEIPRAAVTEPSQGSARAVIGPDGAETGYFSVDGMHCTTCEAFLRACGRAIEGVYDLELNYGLGAARVQYDPDRLTPSKLAEALSGHGYTFRHREEDEGVHPVKRRRSRAVQRLVVGGFLSMLIMPWYFFYLYPQYVGFERGILELGRTTTFGIFFPLVTIGVLTTIILCYTGYPVLRGAWISVRTGRPNMDLLVVIAALAAYAYSVVALALGRTHLYFDVTVMVIMVVSLGRYYEEGLRANAAARLEAISTARVETATRITEHSRETVPVGDLEQGDEVRVTPGERIPVDGTIASGRADIDQSLLTGESFPVPHGVGDEVVGGAKVLDGTITVSIGTEASSTIDRIATSMWEIQTARAGIQRFVDSLATVFVPIVLALGILVTTWQLAAGNTVAGALLAGLTVLLVSCPCAMGLATPLALSAGLRDALRQGIVVTNETVFEVAPDANTVVFDKTGTLTRGQMTVSAVDGESRGIELAAAVERYVDHPIANAIVRENDESMDTDGGHDRPLSDAEAEREDLAVQVTRHPGEGVEGTVDGETVVIGTPELVQRRAGEIPPYLSAAIEEIRTRGELPVAVGWDGCTRTVISLVDQTREQWSRALTAFDDHEIVVLTGDKRDPGPVFTDHPTIDHILTGVPPDGKSAAIERFAKHGSTVMIGDGTNDAPALARADLGIAMSGGTAAASDAADVVMLENDLTALPAVFELANGTRRRIRENVGWALLYNAIAIPLAVVGAINPFFAAVAMATSSIIVVTNSRRPVRKGDR